LLELYRRGLSRETPALPQARDCGALRVHRRYHGAAAGQR